MAFESLTKLVILGLPDLSAYAMCGQMLGFIKNHQIPSRCVQEPFDTCRTFQRIDAGNQPIMFSKGVRFSVSNITLGTEYFEV